MSAVKTFVSDVDLDIRYLYMKLDDPLLKRSGFKTNFTVLV